MNTFTEDRADKVKRNLAAPQAKPVSELAHQLAQVGVDVSRTDTDRIRRVLDLRGRAIDSMSPLSNSIVQHRTDLSFITDALGPNGHNIITEDGLVLIRSAEMAQQELREFAGTYERLDALDSKYQTLHSWVQKGLGAFEGIVGIVEARKLEGGGAILEFDPSKQRDQRLAQTLVEYVDQWVGSGLGDPRLRGLTANELLVAVSNFPDADRKAFELSHPDQVGIVSGVSLGYSIASEFEKISLLRGVDKEGNPYMLKSPDPGITNQIATGPLDR